MSGQPEIPLEFAVRGSEARRQVNSVLAMIRPCRGRHAALSMHTIAANTGVKPRVIQAIVKFLVEERLLPIGTAVARPFGYFWIVNNDERRAVRDHFVRRALSNLDHARAFDSDSIVAELVGQLAMKFPEVKR